MASPQVVQRLEQRAVEADKMLNILKHQVYELRQSAVANAASQEEEKLRKENEELKKLIKKTRDELIQAENQNGVKQVPLPVNSKNTQSSPPREQPDKQLKSEATSSEQPNKHQKSETLQNASQKPEKKQKKKEGKPKPQPADDKPIDVSRLDMRIGHIISAKRHPDADSLYVEEVDLGEGRNRTILSGLVKHVPIEEMQDRLAIFMCNLKPAKMRGIMSEGMIMCASTPEKVEIISPPEGAVIGDRITVDGYLGEPDGQLNPKKKIFEQIQPDFLVNGDGLASYKGSLWKVGNKGTCKAPSLTNVGIK